MFNKYSIHQKSRLALLIWLAVVLGTISLVIPPDSRANGGAAVFTQDSGPFNVQLFISPTPPVPTVPAHFTMIVTRRSSDVPVTDATAFVEPAMSGMPMPGVTGQRFIQNQSRPDQYDVDVPVAMEGVWNFKVTIVSPGLGTTNFIANAKVEKPDAPWPIIIAILVALPALAGLTWWFLFRKQAEDDDEEEDPKPEVKVGT